MPTTVFTQAQQLMQWRTSLPQGETVALVPTMGNLHAGHVALIQLAQQHAHHVVVSVFVNPTQFGPTEDFNRYPRTLEADTALCQAQGVSALWLPTAEELYPLGTETTQRFTCHPPASLANVACGEHRPGHFEGVATVVLKLLLLAQPHVAVFGEKDAQQLAIIQALVKDWHLPTRILPHPVVREANGLAMSSRNRYLVTPALQRSALALSEVTHHVAKQVKQASQPLPTELAFANAIADLAQQWPCPVAWQYTLAVNPTTFEPLPTVAQDARLLVAATLTHAPHPPVRLIDTLLCD
jgi:pantoate ligase/cytidylate kinase